MREEKRKEETPKERFIVLKFASLFTSPIAATEVNTHLSSDNLENCQTLRESARGLKCARGCMVVVCVGRYGVGGG